MVSDSRYIVGIDLGTTNTAMAYVDTDRPAEERSVEVFLVPQLVAAGEVAELGVLPSFVYLPAESDVVADTLRLPWHEEAPTVAVGAFARDMAAQQPGKVVSSAKSWLCYDGIDRREACLPFSRDPVARRISPVEASRLYLAHLRDAWNHKMAADDDALRLENQTVLLTVPASFDAVARELTMEAATEAGLRPRLLEEPQSAFYAWLHQRGEAWRDSVSDGDVILVCDVGGGTTDFSLIAVMDREGDLELQRIAVGEHTLLGGDNMDLTLAYGMVEKLKREQGVELDGRQIAALTHACRAAKEKVGNSDDVQTQPLTILGRGSGVVGGSISTEISAEEMRDLLVDGFFPQCDITEGPAERRRVGLRTFGLEYAADPALTRHLAGFINRHSFQDAEGNPMLPTAILFNGGVTKSPVFQERVVDVLRSWNASSSGDVLVLEQDDADLSVALGAAWYGTVQREGGVRIKAGSARSYYIGVESSLPAVPGFAPPVEALCVVSFGLEEGSSVDVEAEDIGLVVGEPTEFRFFSSTVRQDDAIGTVLSQWRDDELEEMPPMVVELPLEDAESSSIGSLVPVSLRTELTEIGTLQLWCDDQRGDGHSWKLEFELRGNDSTQQ